MKKLTIDTIKSNNVKRCLDCGIPITSANDSGWEGFTVENKTQPICAWCDVKRNNIVLKEK